MKKVYETEIVTKINRVIEMKRIEKTNFAFYTDTRIINKNGKEERITYKGISSVENINKAKDLDDVNTKIPVSNMYEKKAKVVILSKKALSDVYAGKKHISEIVEYYTENRPYNKDEDILALWNLCAYELADLDYNFIPLPIQFGYLEGGVSEDKYNLNSLLEKLKLDPYVINKESLQITDIPYYNSYEGHTKSIEFLYLPSKELWNEMKKDNKLRNTQAMRKYILNEIINVKDCICEEQEREQ